MIASCEAVYHPCSSEAVATGSLARRIWSFDVGRLERSAPGARGVPAMPVPGRWHKKLPQRDADRDARSSFPCPCFALPSVLAHTLGNTLSGGRVLGHHILLRKRASSSNVSGQYRGAVNADFSPLVLRRSGQ